MRLSAVIAATAALLLAGCGQPATSTTRQSASETTPAAAGAQTAPAAAIVAQAGEPSEAARCMAYTTMQRQAVLSGRAQGDATALLQATARWRASAPSTPEFQQLYQAAMGAQQTMDAAALKAAADDCVARAPAA
jgi:hypothetical protein